MHLPNFMKCSNYTCQVQRNLCVLLLSFAVIGLHRWGICSHIMGAEIRYRCLNGQAALYEVTLTMYRDCDEGQIGFDRWGRELYRTTNPDFQWRGVDASGNPVPEGHYAFLLKAETPDQGLLRKSGTIAIVR